MYALIPTQRLLLRLGRERDVDAITDFVCRNREFLQPWEPLHPAPYFTRGFQLALLKKDIQRAKCGESYRFWLWRADRMIGGVALDDVCYGPFQSATIGYRLDEHEQGQGYMVEALTAVMAWAFGELELHRLEAQIMLGNGRSLRTAYSLGFKEEGLARQYLKINGTWEDHLRLALLNSEYERRS